MTAYSRNGLDFNEQFASICTSVAALPAHHAVIDGEVVVQGANGVPDFGALPREPLTPEQKRRVEEAVSISGCVSPAFRSSAKSSRTTG